jgi:Activator of Hsp90 ATPase homolog 1-like protein
MSSVETKVEPVRRTVVVNRSVEDAFRVFTEEIGKWWALDVHSLSLDRTGAPAETAFMEGRVGGRLYERMSDGTEADWGRLDAWEPPHRVAFEWFVTGTPTQVDVRFVAEGDATRVELVHSGFDRLEDAERRRNGYDEGWALGLGRYAEAANAS